MITLEQFVCMILYPIRNNSVWFASFYTLTDAIFAYFSSEFKGNITLFLDLLSANLQFFCKK